MDYPEDPEVRDLSDQWLFGPALMACPVFEYKATSRSVYFPEGTWYDFYTGERIEIPGQAGNDVTPDPDRASGGRRVTVDAPYERIPLYVRAGSIIPMGPDMEWTDEKPLEEITLMVYPGADSDFTIYEDDGLTYGYERGEYAVTRIHWDDAAGKADIGPREGSYPGMPESRTYKVVVVGK